MEAVFLVNLPPPGRGFSPAEDECVDEIEVHPNLLPRLAQSGRVDKGDRVVGAPQLILPRDTLSRGIGVLVGGPSEIPCRLLYDRSRRRLGDGSRPNPQVDGAESTGIVFLSVWQTVSLFD